MAGGFRQDATSEPFGIQNIYRLPASLGTTNAALLTPVGGPITPRRLYFAHGIITSLYSVYLKFYDKGLVAPVPGTDTPLLTVGLSANTYWNGTTAIASPAAFEFTWADIGITFRNGIGIAITKNPADADATAVTAGDITALAIGWQ